MQRSLKNSLVSRTTAVLGFALLLFGSVGHGDTLVMQPEELRLSAANPVENLQFRNTSSTETTLSFAVVQWQQQEDREWLSPSSKLIVLPEKLTLKPGESGRVRVGLRLSGSWWEEEAFRIMVTETPSMPDVGVKSSFSSRGLVTRPSSLSVFLLPPGKANPRLSWSFKRNSEGGVILRALNQGKGHVQLKSASLLGPAGQSIQKHNMADVLLPGGARSWELTSDAAAGLWYLTVDTNDGPIRTQLELQPDDSSFRALSFSQ